MSNSPEVIVVTGVSSGFGRIATDQGLRISGLDLDVQLQDSVDTAVAEIIRREGRIDVIVHNAGRMVLGPAEAFAPEQGAEIYDDSCDGTRWANRAALPHIRSRRSGLLVWVGSSSTRGGHPPLLAPRSAAKAAMDALAESYAGELIRIVGLPHGKRP